MTTVLLVDDLPLGSDAIPTAVHPDRDARRTAPPNLRRCWRALCRVMLLIAAITGTKVTISRSICGQTMDRPQKDISRTRARTGTRPEPTRSPR